MSTHNQRNEQQKSVSLFNHLSSIIALHRKQHLTTEIGKVINSLVLYSVLYLWHKTWLSSLASINLKIKP
jgi:hypothetical protein